MQKQQLFRVVEALLYMTDHPLKLKEIVEIIDLKSIQEEQITEVIQQIQKNLDDTESALTLTEVAGGIQMATRPEMAVFVRKLYKERLTVRLSPSALETLSIVAYKQPISKNEIEQIRGVEASGVIDTLLERGLVKVVGRKETIGRPRLYGTTPDFLRQFGLKHLSELPDLATLPTQAIEGEEGDTAEGEQETLPLEGEGQETVQENEENLVPAGVAAEAPEESQPDAAETTEPESEDKNV